MAAHSDCSSIFQGFNRQGEVAPKLGWSQIPGWLKKKKKKERQGEKQERAAGWPGLAADLRFCREKKKKKTICLSAVATEQLGSAHGVIFYYFF